MSVQDVLFSLGSLALIGTGLIGRRVHQDTRGWKRKEIGSDYDVIVVHGAGYQKTEDDGYELTERGIDRVEGALRLYENSSTARFIVCGGDVYGEGISEATVMRNYLVEKDISEGRITLVEDTLETSSNVERAVELTNTEEKVASITSHENVPRTQRLYRNYGKSDIDVYSAERVVGKPIDTWQNRGYYLWEIPWYLLLIVDPKGRIPQWLAKRRRGTDAVFNQEVPTN